jgi:adenine-specific DNA methylase
MSNLKLFNGLASYIGGKRLLAQKILDYAEGDVLIDAFAGACSVSLLAKHRGFEVISNDISQRSYVSQLALIENSTEKISEDDIARLFIPMQNDGFIEKTYCPKFFTREGAKFLDNAFAVIQTIENVYKKALLQHLLSVYILHIRSFSRFGLVKDTQSIENGTSGEILEIATRSRVNKMLQTMAHPFVILQEIAKDINRAIVNTGKKCKANNLDVFEFLKQVQGSTLYSDPPYSSSASYESTYEIWDSVLAGKEIKLPISAFNRKDVEQSFHQMFESAQHIPLWLTSMGKNPDGKGISFDGEELLTLVKEHRPNSTLVKFNHRWSINTMAGKDQKENIEYLLISKK